MLVGDAKKRHEPDRTYLHKANVMNKSKVDVPWLV